MSIGSIQHTAIGEMATPNNASAASAEPANIEAASNYSYITHSAVPSLVSAALIFTIAMLLPDGPQDSAKPSQSAKAINVSSMTVK